MNEREKEQVVVVALLFCYFDHVSSLRSTRSLACLLADVIGGGRTRTCRAIQPSRQTYE